MTNWLTADQSNGMICKAGVWAAIIVVAAPLASSPSLAQESTALRGPYLGQTPPGDTPVLFAPDLMRDPGEYHSPVVFSPDGTEVFWSPMPGHGRNTTLMSRMVDGSWTGQIYEDFGLEAGATEVTFSPDGRTIFFLSTQMPEGGGTARGEEGPRERIWSVSRTPEGVGTPRPLPEVVTAYPTHWQFSVAASGNLYFTSQGLEGEGGAEIYMAPFDGGTYLEPRPLGPAINTPALEHCPFVAPDESYLIFTRNVRDEDRDLFISYRQMDGSWGDAEGLPSPINTGHTEIYPVVSPDGKYLFFLSWREGAGRMFWVEAGFLRPRAPDLASRPSEAG